MSDNNRRPGFVTTEAAADHLGVSVATIRRRISDGTLPAFQIGGRRTLRVRMADVEQLAVRIPVGAS